MLKKLRSQTINQDFEVSYVEATTCRLVAKSILNRGFKWNAFHPGLSFISLRLLLLTNGKSTGDQLKLNGDFRKSQYLLLLDYVNANKEKDHVANSFYIQYKNNLRKA